MTLSSLNLGELWYYSIVRLCRIFSIHRSSYLGLKAKETRVSGLLPLLRFRGVILSLKV